MSNTAETGCYGICGGLCTMIFGVMFSTIALAVAGSYWDSECMDKQMLDIWLLVNGIFIVTLTIINVPLVVAGAISKPARVLHHGLLGVQGIVMIGFAIWGSVALFEHAPDCKDDEPGLWATGLIYLILSYIGAIGGTCTIACLPCSIKKICC